MKLWVFYLILREREKRIIYWKGIDRQGTWTVLAAPGPCSKEGHVGTPWYKPEGRQKITRTDWSRLITTEGQRRNRACGGSSCVCGTLEWNWLFRLLLVTPLNCWVPINHFNSYPSFQWKILNFVLSQRGVLEIFENMKISHINFPFGNMHICTYPHDIYTCSGCVKA